MHQGIDYYLLPIPSNSRISCNDHRPKKFVTPDTTNQTFRTLLAPNSSVTYQIPMLHDHRSTEGRNPIVVENVLASEWFIQGEWARGRSPRTVGSIRDISRSTQTSALIAEQWKGDCPFQDWIRCHSEKSKY
ncbi:hypothetical protein ASPBRDRAFT_71958 [Aspergillus brasiliensis CBS 101740]|uniref:Uncharacterized protein n=1 Tax=Aspergillus brasiliensis (strain CBS 101740 / IMI 381727 / IBT 21946) TaxID=767769 RepID=A0A1L9UVW5_ASPBC|nr:hypothetical protein ASPBRDRAFT_71958 [Aspergillus brasiliensis CBS 101740]